MNVALGRSGILLGLLACLAGAATLAWGIRRRQPRLLRSGASYAVLIFVGALVATVAMEHALFTHDFRIGFVADNNSKETPLLYDFTGLWSALQGSLLLWTLILSGYLLAMVVHFRKRASDAVVAWATLVTYLVSAFFFVLLAWPANPFATISPVPADGQGPNPLLQDRVLVAIHPPLLYLGYVGFTVPFAFALASLITGRVGDGWLAETRRWTLLAWGFLSVGIVAGAWWSYEVLGWGGFWAWDPVENAALLPWLVGTAYLHSAVVQERRGLLKVWNLSLLVATFALTILGTFLTRSGVLQSVHAFSNSDLGPALIGFFLVVTIAGIALIFWRADRLTAAGRIDSLVSREGAFLLNNVAFAAFAAVVLLGTVFPLFDQAFTNQSVSVGAPYFDTTVGPVALVLLFLMAVAPVLPWRQASAALVSRRLRWPAWAATVTVVGCVIGGVRGLTLLVAIGLATFAGASALRQLAVGVRSSLRSGSKTVAALLSRSTGGMVVHLGVVMIAVALVSATSYGRRGQVTLLPGHSTVFDGHRLTYRRSLALTTPATFSEEAVVAVDGHDLLSPALTRFGADTTAVSSPAIDSGVVDDVYLTVVTAASSKSGAVTIAVVVQPLVRWMWVGGGIVGAGAVLALASRRGPRRRRSGREGLAGSDLAARLDAASSEEMPAPVPLAGVSSSVQIAES